MRSLIKQLLGTRIGRKILNKGASFIQKYYFKDLEIRIAVENGMIAPLCFEDSTSSFSEVFVFKEYEQLVIKAKKWIDLGSNNGFFSLFLASKTDSSERKNLQALLIDGDPRSLVSLQEIKKVNQDLEGLRFEQGIITRGTGNAGFEIKRHMFSKVNQESELKVPILSQEHIMKQISPPFDLIKVDIEGSEVDFIQNYPQLLRQTKALIIEWHSWNPQRISAAGFKQLLSDSGFLQITSFNPRLIGQKEEQNNSCVTFLAQK
jgi:FkbM family methyltransferase